MGTHRSIGTCWLFSGFVLRHCWICCCHGRLAIREVFRTNFCFLGCICFCATTLLNFLSSWHGRQATREVFATGLSSARGNIQTSVTLMLARKRLAWTTMIVSFYWSLSDSYWRSRSKSTTTGELIWGSESRVFAKVQIVRLLSECHFPTGIEEVTSATNIAGYLCFSIKPCIGECWGFMGCVIFYPNFTI